MNQSEFMAITCNFLKAREKLRVLGTFGFASHWLKNSLEIFKPTARRGNRNRAITFDSHLKSIPYVQTRSNCTGTHFSALCSPIHLNADKVIGDTSFHCFQSSIQLSLMIKLFNCSVLSGYLASLVMVSVFRRILLSPNNLALTCWNSDRRGTWKH